MSEKTDRVYNNFTMIKALEETDKDLAIKAISDPNLDPKELSEIIECSLLGKIVMKKSNEPLKLSNEVLMAGIRNRLYQIERDTEK